MNAPQTFYQPLEIDTTIKTKEKISTFWNTDLSHHSPCYLIIIFTKQGGKLTKTQVETEKALFAFNAPRTLYQLLQTDTTIKTRKKSSTFWNTDVSHYSLCYLIIIFTEEGDKLTKTQLEIEKALG